MLEKAQFLMIIYDFLLNTLKYEVTFYYFWFTFYVFFLAKKLEAKDISYIDKAPNIEQKYFSVDIDRLNNFNDEDKSNIKLFIDTLIKNMKKEDLKILYNNINSLKIDELNSLTARGRYNVKTNTISLKIKDSIFHELFHMASSYHINNIFYSGFNPANKTNIGCGLNEGYTEYLTQKYFKENISDEVYIFEKEIAEAIAILITDDKMESLYLRADLLGLIEELKMYAEEDDIMQFICNLDFYKKYKNKTNNFIIRGFLKVIIENIKNFILKLYINLAAYLFEENDITETDIENILNWIILKLINLNNNPQNSTTIPNFEAIFDEYFINYEFITTYKDNRILSLRLKL